MRTVKHGTIKFSAELMADVANSHGAYHNKWTPEADAFVVQYYGTMPMEEFITIMNKHFNGDFKYRAIYERRKILKRKVA